MSMTNVLVFGSTGAQGIPQVRELCRAGIAVRAVSRRPDAFSALEFADVVAVAADYSDRDALATALTDVDAVFFQAPVLGDRDRLLGEAQNVANAARRAAVRLVIVNSSMWSPGDAPCGDPIYDRVASMENIFLESGVPCIVFQPTLFMDNLQGDWVRTQIANGMYSYCHKPQLQADWISLGDVAKYMVAALDRPDLVGRKIRLGGPERLTTLEVLAILSETVGTKVELDYLTPRQFGEGFWQAFGNTSGLDRETFIDNVESFYTFNNDAPQRPFEMDSSVTRELLPMELSDLRTWASTQNWS